MVSAMLALSLLAVFALAAAHLAVDERRGAFNEFVRSGAFLSADSGGEAAVNWLLVRSKPVPIVDFASKRVTASATQTLHGTQRYDFDIRFMQTRPRAGYDLSHMDYIYGVDSRGQASRQGSSNIALVVHKLGRAGHQGF